MTSGAAGPKMPELMAKGGQYGEQKVRDNIDELQTMIAEEARRLQSIQGKQAPDLIQAGVGSYQSRFKPNRNTTSGERSTAMSSLTPRSRRQPEAKR